MKTTLINSVPFIPLDTLKGNRYTIQELRPLVEPYIDSQNDMVLPAVADQLRRLLSGKMSEVFLWKNQQRGRLHLINNAYIGLRIMIHEV